METLTDLQIQSSPSTKYSKREIAIFKIQRALLILVTRVTIVSGILGYLYISLYHLATHTCSKRFILIIGKNEMDKMPLACALSHLSSLMLFSLIGIPILVLLLEKFNDIRFKYQKLNVELTEEEKKLFKRTRKQLEDKDILLRVSKGNNYLVKPIE